MSYIDKRKSKTVTLEELVMQAGYELASALQWSRHLEWAENFHKYVERATAIIEICEIIVCGSTGGYDQSQKETQESHGLFNRWLWLFEHYTPFDDKKGFSKGKNDGWYKVRDLKEAFEKK